MRSKAYEEAIFHMYELVIRDHGGCDQEDCSINRILDDENKSAEDVIVLWAQTGAACHVFDALYDKWGSKIERIVKAAK